MKYEIDPEPRKDFEIHSVCGRCGRGIHMTEMTYPQYLGAQLQSNVCPACQEEIEHAQAQD